MKPARRICFYNAGDFRSRLCRTNANEHVHMVGGAIDDERGATNFANDAAEVGEQIGANFRSDERLAILGAEDQVEDEIAGGMGQVSFAPSELAVFFGCLPTACAVGCILALLSQLTGAYDMRLVGERRAGEILRREFHFGASLVLDSNVSQKVVVP